MDRQTIIETNRSLRLIKNELESLLEKGVLTDSAFDSITTLLPAETPLSAASRSTTTTTTTSSSVPTPATTITTPSTASSPAPPSYAASTAVPPSLPIRNNPAPPSEPPSKPVLAHARALYRYAATDPRDLSFERDDRVAVHEYMNDDWWLGSNLRTGQEGIFPRNYVVVDAQSEKQQPASSSAAAVPIPGYPQPQYAPGPGPYAVQHQQQQHEGEEKESKMAEHGKKFGKKLGNAAIFGAGATIGSNIVNSIF
ncbi:hypothetical protein VTJ49DRAFT_3325 [Mycothermus thermophilus]|uniref:SH3 domain-containing protein n=1 Tax=Humicola insolens TaxID=85995 RepID=A0ABR3V7T9_HUMIN